MSLILAALQSFAGASSASAQAMQDRYGPPRSRPAAPVRVASLAARPYEGRLLSWSSRAAAPPPEAAAPAAHRAPGAHASASTSAAERARA